MLTQQEQEIMREIMDPILNGVQLTPEQAKAIEDASNQPPSGIMGKDLPSRLEGRIAAFVAKAIEVTAEYWKQAGYTHAPAPIYKVEISEKWAKVYKWEERGGELRKDAIYAFIAMDDNTTKTLGVIKKGDIHKPASYKLPAKHARGNVFQEDFGNCIGPISISYLR